MKFVLLVLLAFLLAQASPNQPAGSKKTLPKTYLEETKGLSGSDGCPQKLQRCAGGCGLKVGRRCWALTKALGVQETTEIIKFYQDINLKKSMRSLLFRKTMSSIFLTHGGGPFPILKHEEHTQFRKNLQEIAKRNPNPKAIIIFSAHWEEHQWTLLDHDTPSLYYDYYGFPPESYNLSYSMTSSSELRQLVKNSLEKQGVPLKTDTKRGYDHGVFIPMMVLYPEKKAPVIQISILKSLNPEAHYRMGVAMRELKKMGFLIIGSGSSCHGGFFSEKATKWSAQFEQALASRIVGSKGDDGLLQVAREWSKLPHAKQMHPREEHLVPLWINLGAHEGNTREVMTYKLYSLFLSNYILS